MDTYGHIDTRAREPETLTVKLCSIAFHVIGQTIGAVVTISLGIWAIYVYHTLNAGIHPKPTDTLRCNVGTIKNLILADSILNFVSLAFIVCGACSFIAETCLIEPDEEGKKKNPLSSLANSCRSCIGLASLIILIILTNLVFKSNGCSSEAPQVFAYVKPYVIANYILLAVQCIVGICLCCAILCGATVLAIFAIA